MNRKESYRVSRGSTRPTRLHINSKYRQPKSLSTLWVRIFICPLLLALGILLLYAGIYQGIIKKEFVSRSKSGIWYATYGSDAVKIGIGMSVMGMVFLYGTVVILRTRIDRDGINGKKYSSIEEIPADIRSAFEKALGRAHGGRDYAKAFDMKELYKAIEASLRHGFKRTIDGNHADVTGESTDRNDPPSGKQRDQGVKKKNGDRS